MKKTFDAVQWMRQRRTQIDEEDRGLSWEEKRRKTHEIVMRDPILAPLCTRTVYPSGFGSRAPGRTFAKSRASSRRSGRTNAIQGQTTK